tara:strand:+ start:1303 stop:1953 length:651 start_codon:yes stop_codon:yes gene_type:complete
MSLINEVAAIIGSHYIKYNWDEILKKPPSDDSELTRKELELIAHATRNRSPEAYDLIMKVDKDPLLIFMDFLEDKNIIVKRVEFDRYWNVMENYSYAMKYHFNRTRPYDLAKEYNIEMQTIYTDTHNTPAYPSGHAMYGYLAAEMLTEKFPQYKEDFSRLAELCGIARILQGVHYPSDNNASKIAVSKLYPKMKEQINEQQGKEQKGKEFPIDFQS